MDFAQIVPPTTPSAWLDMDALDHNIALVNQKTQAVSLRLATTPNLFAPSMFCII